MRISLALLILLAALPLSPQTAIDAKPPAAASPVPQPGAFDYVCPMDPDMRSDKPGLCPRCGMKLVLGIPDQTEYPLDLEITPRVFHAGDQVQFAFTVRDPHTNQKVERFEIVHEKLFHMFLVSGDLQYFVHDHPVFGKDAVYRYDAVFPKPGMYRILGDFYPAGGAPQLVSKTVFVPGGAGAAISLEDARLAADLAPKHAENLDVELAMEPPQPVAGAKTLLFFRLKPAEGLQKYLGAWAHMLAASDDTIDLIHEHPFIADGGPQMQFNLIFPRARVYRLWVQFQRNGVVNTAAFNVPVSELK